MSCVSLIPLTSDQTPLPWCGLTRLYRIQPLAAPWLLHSLYATRLFWRTLTYPSMKCRAFLLAVSSACHSHTPRHLHASWLPGLCSNISSSVRPFQGSLSKIVQPSPDPIKIYSLHFSLLCLPAPDIFWLCLFFLSRMQL